MSILETRALVAAAAVVALAGCDVTRPHYCLDNDSCVVNGAQGVCEPIGFCSFPDTECDSNRRYGGEAGDGLADQCVLGTTADASTASDAIDLDRSDAAPPDGLPDAGCPAVAAPLFVPDVAAGRSHVGPTLFAGGAEVYFAVGTMGQFDVAVAARPGWGALDGPVRIVEELSTPADEITPFVTPDGLTMLYASDAGGDTGFDLWSATRPDTSSPFEDAAEIGIVNSNGHEDSPYLTDDGLTLYFASDRAGPSAGTNIWRATRATPGSDFGLPVALPAPVNDDSNSQRPRPTADGLSMYFASDRAGGQGGMDIWLATRASVTDEFGAPTNLAAVNSEDTDDGIDFGRDDHVLVFHSDRAGTGHELWRVGSSCD